MSNQSTTAQTQQELESMNAVQLRKAAQEKYPGRSADIRKLNRSRLVEMLAYDIALDDMLRREQGDAGNHSSNSSNKGRVLSRFVMGKLRPSG